MSMTRKDYVALAGAINKARRGDIKGIVNQTAAEMAVRIVEEEIALDLQNDNPRFDRERFLAACRKGEVQS